MKDENPFQKLVVFAAFCVFVFTPEFSTVIGLVFALAFHAFSDFQNREKNNLISRLVSAENSISTLTKSLSISNSSLETLKSEVSAIRVQKGLENLRNIPSPFTGNMRGGS